MIHISRKAKRAYLGLLSLIALVILLVGLFFDVYDFTIDLVITIAFWGGLV